MFRTTSRNRLADVLPDKMRPSPKCTAVLGRMLDGEDVDAATAALADVVARLVEIAVEWPESFGPRAVRRARRASRARDV